MIRTRAYCFPGMVEVVPVKTGCYILFCELIKIVVNLEPFLVNQNSYDVRHKRKLRCGYFFQSGRIGADHLKALIVKACKIIDQMQPPDKVCFVHIEGRCQDVNIKLSVIVGVHEDILTISRRVIKDIRGVVFLVHKLQTVGHCAERNRGVFNV